LSALANLRSVAPAFQDRLRRLGDHPMVGETRGIGLMGALELVADKSAKRAYPAELRVSERIARQALKNGLICRPLGQSVVLAPPFIITPAEIEELFAILERTMDEVHAGLGVTAG
jgi:adenosylmethionine-8-amino-7-oxononanoate aminotransferase